MKKKNEKNHVRSRLSTILLCILAIVLCAAPRGWAVFYDDGDEHDVTTDLDWLEVGTGTTVNLRCASVSQYVYAYPGSILNIYSGNVGWYVLVKPAMAAGSSEPEAVVTVYGSGFKVNGDSVSYGPIVIDNFKWIYEGILTGIYENLEPIELKFVSIVPILIHLVEPPDVSEVEIQIDIKPGGNPNNINLKSKGIVPVAVLTTDSFDASTVDPNTVTFAGAEPVRWTLDDVDDDGDKDMLFHFKTRDLKLDESITEAAEAKKATETTLTLTGNKKTDVKIQGTDTVRIVSGKK